VHDRREPLDPLHPYLANFALLGSGVRRRVEGAARTAEHEVDVSRQRPDRDRARRIHRAARPGGAFAVACGLAFLSPERRAETVEAATERVEIRRVPRDHEVHGLPGSRLTDHHELDACIRERADNRREVRDTGRRRHASDDPNAAPT
jgi:hypothetical protein